MKTIQTGILALCLPLTMTGSRAGPLGAGEPLVSPMPAWKNAPPVLAGSVDPGVQEREKGRATGDDQHLSVAARVQKLLERGAFEEALGLCQVSLKRQEPDPLVLYLVGKIYFEWDVQSQQPGDSKVGPPARTVEPSEPTSPRSEPVHGCVRQTAD